MAKTKKSEKISINNPLEEKSITKPAGNNIFDSEGELVVDVFEDKDHFIVVSAIAGVSIKDLDISVEKDMMVIKGNRVNPHNNSEKTYFYQECYFGNFSRKIVLPEALHTEKAAAEMDKGMLVIKIPKMADMKKEEA